MTNPSTSKCTDQFGHVFLEHGDRCYKCGISLITTTHNQEYCECDVTTTPVAPPDRRCVVCKLPRHNQEEGVIVRDLTIDILPQYKVERLGTLQEAVEEIKEEWEKEFDELPLAVAYKIGGQKIIDFDYLKEQMDEIVKPFISKVHNEAARKFYQMGYDESKSDAIQEERERLAGEIKMAIGIKLEKTPITPDDPAKEYLSKAHVLSLIRTNTK